MDQDREERVRARAYEIWEHEGQPEGGHEAHWSQAEREIDTEANGQPESAAEDLATKGEDSARVDAGAPAAAATGSSGLASGLQPSGTAPSASPGTGTGSIGTGGGSTAGKPTGTVKRKSRSK